MYNVLQYLCSLDDWISSSTPFTKREIEEREEHQARFIHATFIVIILPIFINNRYMNFLLDFEVDKPSKILIKTSNVAEYIESDIQNIDALITDDPII